MKRYNPEENTNPFIHEGRAVKIGDEILDKRTGKIAGRVGYLLIDHNGVYMQIPNNGVTHEISIGNPDFTFADYYKKKTYLWAYPSYGIPGSVTVELKRMTKEEGDKIFGARIIPETEEES